MSIEYIKNQEINWDANVQKFNDPFKQINFTNLNNNPYSSIFKEIMYYINLWQVSNNKVIEIGCGNGLLLKEFLGTFTEVYGNDLSSSLLKEAKKIHSDFVLNHSEAKLIDYEDNYFDCLICNSVFQYFPDKNYAKETVREFLRVTKTGGMIFIGDIYNERLEELYNKYYIKRSTSQKIKDFIKKGLIYFRLYDKGKLFKYLYLDPMFFIDAFENDAIIIPKLIVSEKPDLFKMFRYDIVMYKK